MYGLGAAEGELGRFARGKRDQGTIATKFGIQPPEATILTRLQRPARALIARYPALRRIVKRHQGALQQPRRYDLETARSSLDRSLTELGTDYVDILFVHDPREEDDLAIEELREFLEGAVQAGRIRSWGVSGEPKPVGSIRTSCPDDAVIQARDDIFTREPEVLQAGRPQITFGLLSSALPRIVSHVAASEAVRRRWSEAVSRDCSDPTVIASLLLRDGLLSNSDGVVLFGTTKRDRVRVAAAASELMGDPALFAFQDLVHAELTQIP
jgi:D-threo-aldose 1-dehydrogenase